MSTGAVLAFLRRPNHYRDWSQQEIAEFYRVESALLQGGCAVATDRGISDEGDPWFVFLRADTEEVIAHIARIDGDYVIVSSAHPLPVRGRDFHLLIRRMIETQPVMLPVRRSQGNNVFLHPAALLIALLASAYILSEKDAVGANSPSHNDAQDNSIASLLTSNFSLLTAVGLVALWLEHQADSVLKFFESTDLSHESIVSNTGSQHASGLQQGSDLFDIGFDKAEWGDQALSHKLSSLKLDLAAAQATDQHAELWTVLHSNATQTPADGKFSAPNDLTPPNGDAAAAPHVDANQNSNDLLLNVAQLLPEKDADAVPQWVNQLVPSSSVIASSSQSGATAQLIPSSSADNLTSSGSAATVAPNEASQIIAAEFAGLSNEPVVQFSSASALSLSLQQELGISTNLMQELTANLAGAGAASTASSSDIAGQVTAAVADGSPVSAPIEDQSGGSTNGSAATASGTPSAGVRTADAGSSQNDSHTTAQATSHLSVTLPAPSTVSIEQTLNAFLNNTPSYEVAMSGENVVIIDTNSADLKSAHYGVLTWDMSDGSTLTIMGILPHYHLLAAAA